MSADYTGEGGGAAARGLNTEAASCDRGSRSRKVGKKINILDEKNVNVALKNFKLLTKVKLIKVKVHNLYYGQPL
jgi:hypothetical protein